MASVLLDAGVMVALFGDHEPHSARYHALFLQAAQARWHISTTWPCVVEASHLLGPRHRHQLLRWIAAGAVTVFPFDQEQLTDMVLLMERYTEPPRSEMDLADASLVWLAAETGVTAILSLDVRDFSRYRLPDGRSFEIL
jgi:uncharacterized protein